MEQYIDMKNIYRITNLSTPLDGKEPPTKDYVDNTFLDRDGSYPMKGNLNIKEPLSNFDTVNKEYVDRLFTRLNDRIDELCKQ